MSADSKMESTVKELNTLSVNTLEQLNDIWNTLGLTTPVREERFDQILKYVKELYDDMLEQEHNNKLNIIIDIEVLSDRLLLLKQKLGLNTGTAVNSENKILSDVKNKLVAQCNAYEKMYDERKIKIKDLLLCEQELCDSLGLEQKHLPSTPLPTFEQVSDFETYLEDLSDQKFKREEILVKTRLEILEMINNLEINPSTDFERCVVEYNDSEEFKVTDANMKKLKEWYDSLVKERDVLIENVQKYREQISELWELLEIDLKTRSEFLEAHVISNLKVLKSLRIELEKLQRQKKENIQLFIEKLRKELTHWWSKCYVSNETKNNFKHFDSTDDTEELLDIFESEIKKLQKYYEETANIFKLYEKHNSLWDKKIELEHRAIQPDRFKNRGGQLLNEEKERNGIEAQLPKIKLELIKMIEEYETNTNREFLINGERPENIIAKTLENYNENKKIILSERKKLRELNKDLKVTPCKRKLLDTPQSTTNAMKRSRMEFTGSNTNLASSTKIKLSAAKQRRVDSQRSKLNHSKGTTLLTAINYNTFKNEIHEKPSCRSSLFPLDQALRNNDVQTYAAPGNTPRKALVTVSNTPHKQERTPRKLTPKKHQTLIAKFSMVPEESPINI